MKRQRNPLSNRGVGMFDDHRSSDPRHIIHLGEEKDLKNFISSILIFVC